MGDMDSDDNSGTRGGSSADAKIFSAVITPYRSLGPRGFLIFMLCLGTLSFISGMAFVLMGAWPVCGFFGLDVLLVYLAFRANFRSARAYEEVTVTASELTVRKVSQRGAVREFTVNPLWVRLDRTVHEEFGIERLFLVSRGRRLPIAAFLGPDEKASFARALAGALSEARRGPTQTVLE
jgi:uncharacterized membrane protein